MQYFVPMPDISCVICAYMEAPRIGDVLTAVAGHPLLNEIIVVDDGSTDATAAVVSRFPSITLLRLGRNQGKSRALAAGLRAASGELILYLDADLKHLTPGDISALGEPVLSGETHMAISIRKNSLPIYRAIGLDFVSGERLVPRSLLAAHSEEIERLPPFGIEAFMNRCIIGEKLRIKIVPFEKVINTRKSEKIGAWRGTLADWKMALDVLRVISPLEMIRQNYAMLALSRPRGRARGER
jgi:glycosyltransferase involved in cell wall biosynthesis